MTEAAGTGDFTLAERTVLVTGAANGMGRAISLALAAAGAELLLSGRDRAALDKVASEARSLGGGAEPLFCAVTPEAAGARAAEALHAAASGRTAGLVNVAGGTGPSGKMLWQHGLDDVREIFDVNVFGPFLMMKHVLPGMIAAGGGSIVNIGGTFGHKGAAEASAYAATKWALRGLSKSAALEAGAHGVRINLVSPGPVDGPRLERQFAEAAEREATTADEIYRRITGRAALGRASRDTDVANAVLFLLSDAARNITGQDLLVDGGSIV